VSISLAQIPVGVTAVMPLRASMVGVSGAFLVLADDDERYWCKPLNNFDHPRVPVTEQIVARLGALIGAPVCEGRLVRLDEIVGWEFRPGSGRPVDAGWAHGSRAIDPGLETRTLAHRTDDDNRSRQAGLYALCDWLLGSDVQWLYALDEDNAYYSHDHGYYLGGPGWNIESLRARANEPAPLSIPSVGLDPDELNRLAGALEGMTRAMIEDALSGLPADWPVSVGELESLAVVLDGRRAPVAARLRAMVT
jgi:hypothetical protein